MGLLSRTTFWRAHVLASDVGGGAGGGVRAKKKSKSRIVNFSDVDLNGRRCEANRCSPIFLSRARRRSLPPFGSGQSAPSFLRPSSIVRADEADGLRVSAVDRVLVRIPIREQLKTGPQLGFGKSCTEFYGPFFLLLPKP